MKIIKLLYTKYFLSFSICLISSFVIFFIFSLISNLNEDYLFNIILSISLLNSLQILVYVPIFIFLLSVILLLNFLRSKNEIVIIKSYINLKKLLIFFLPIILIFTILEINKKDLSRFLDEINNNLINENEKPLAKIIINNQYNSKNFTVLNDIDLNNLERTEYRFYRVLDQIIDRAEFSNDLIKSKDGLIANSYTTYENDIIRNINNKKSIEIDLFNMTNNNVVQDISKKNNVFKTGSVYLYIFSILLLFYIFLIFFNKKYVNVKQSLYFPLFVSLLFLMYSFLVFNNTLVIYKNFFELLSCVLIGMLIFKISLNE